MLRYMVKYVCAEKVTMLSVCESDSYSAFKTAVDYIDSGKALECIVYIADGEEWVKVANVRKDESASAPLVPGEGGTIDARELSNVRMVSDEEDKPWRVVKGGAVCMWVGIGWVEERKATQKDCDAFPLVVYPEPTMEIMARA